MYQARATGSLLEAGCWYLLQQAHHVLIDNEKKRGESQTAEVM